MKILITGHRGFIGSNAVKQLSPKHELDFYEWGDSLPNLDNEYDWVLHFGAISSTTERDVEKVMRQNYDFSCWLIEECDHRCTNFQYSSSASVYGKNQEFLESSPVDPLSPYAWSKYLFERYVEKQQWNITVQGFRYFNVYGPGESHKGNMASPYHKFTEQAKSGTIRVFENSENYFRDFIHVDQVIEVQEKFLSIEASGLWNLGTGKVRSFMDVANDVAKHYPASIEYIPMPEEVKNSYQEYTCANTDLLEYTLKEYYERKV